MIRFLKKTNYCFAITLSCAAVLLLIGCATSPSDKLESKIHSMSDGDLINYYHGINERIKDIDSANVGEQKQDQTQTERMASNMPFVFGGEGHDLVQKRKMALKELNRRKLTP